MTVSLQRRKPMQPPPQALSPEREVMAPIQREDTTGAMILGIIATIFVTIGALVLWPIIHLVLS